jgi:hypothetical protein
MSLRSLALAFADGAGSARATNDTGGETAVSSPDAPAPAPGTNGVVKKASDAWWNAQGGPWLAQYHHFASLTAIGVFEGEPHRVHFMDPFDALEYFRQLPDRYRTNHILRQSCLIVWKDNWYCAQPFAETADHDVEVLRAEVARDVASGAAT